jgi:hypothetical protein
MPKRSTIPRVEYSKVEKESERFPESPNRPNFRFSISSLARSIDFGPDHDYGYFPTFAPGFRFTLRENEGAP